MEKFTVSLIHIKNASLCLSVTCNINILRKWTDHHMLEDSFLQVPHATIAVSTRINFCTTVCRSFATRRYIFRTINERFIQFHRNIFQSQYIGHQDLVKWTIGTNHPVAWSLRQRDCR